MRHASLSAALLLGVALAACEDHPSPQPAPPTPSPTQTSRETQPQPVEFRLPDCGDGDAPCVTQDDGAEGPGMYLVTNYQPFKAILLPTCNAEDYPTNLPCVLKHQDRQGRWIILRSAP